MGAWRTLAVVAMVLSNADGIVTTCIVANVKASVVKPVTSLVCGAIFVDDAADRGAPVDGVVGVPCEESRRTLTLSRMVVGDTDGSRAAAGRVTYGSTLADIALCLAFVGLWALGIRLALIAGQWAAPTAVVGIARKAWVTATLATVAAGEAGGVQGAIEGPTNFHALQYPKLVWATSR